MTDPTSARKPAAAARPASATTAAAPAATDQNIHLALQQLGQALSAAAAASRPALPRDERRTMHQRQADATERQLLLLRRLRAVEPRAPALSVGQLAEALQPLAKRGTTQPAFLSRDILNTIWRRSGHGAVQRLWTSYARCPCRAARLRPPVAMWPPRRRRQRRRMMARAVSPSFRAHSIAAAASLARSAAAHVLSSRLLRCQR